MKIADYKTIEGRTVAELDMLVKEAIKQKFQPLGGGYALNLTGTGYMFYQAMVKFEDPHNN